MAIQNQKVSASILTCEQVWDVDLISDIFKVRDANIIMSIPLSNETDDSCYWRHEKMGNYSVKSTYMVDSPGFWRKMWNLKISPKVKNFLWRALTNCLPTKDLLRMKHVDVNSMCHVCNTMPESVLHCLVNCNFAAAYRDKAPVSGINEVFSTFPDYLQTVFNRSSTNEIHTVVMICWMLWKNMNDLVWKQRGMDSTEVVESAFSVISQWQSVQEKTFDYFLGFMTQEDGKEHWQPPMTNRVKVNFDAAIFEDFSSHSHALVVRDHNGTLVEAVSKCKQGNVSPELAEAMEIREALSWVKNKQQTEAVVETGLHLVQLIRRTHSSLSYLGRVVRDGRDLLAGLKHQNTVLRFVKRSANRVARYLARYSCLVAYRRWEIGNIPSEFQYVLLKDLNNQ